MFLSEVRPVTAACERALGENGQRAAFCCVRTKLRYFCLALRTENVFYFESNIEIDFYVPCEKLAVQVSLQVLDDMDTLGRETRAFVKLRNFIPGSKCLIITNSEEASIECDGIPISVLPAWKWLLDT